MDYFIGQVQLKPRISAPKSDNDTDENDDEKTGDESNIEEAQLMDKKGLNRRPGVLFYELYTYEDLKHF